MSHTKAQCTAEKSAQLNLTAISIWVELSCVFRCAFGFSRTYSPNHYDTVVPGAPRLSWKAVSTVERRWPSVVDPRGCAAGKRIFRKIWSAVSPQFRQHSPLRKKLLISRGRCYTLKIQHRIVERCLSSTKIRRC